MYGSGVQIILHKILQKYQKMANLTYKKTNIKFFGAAAITTVPSFAACGIAATTAQATAAAASVFGWVFLPVPLTKASEPTEGQKKAISLSI